MKEMNGIQTLFEDAVCPIPGGGGDRASSSPGVPVRDAPSATASKVGPMTLTVDLPDSGGAQAAGKSIKGS